jgi:hypothetical protein
MNFQSLIDSGSQDLSSSNGGSISGSGATGTTCTVSGLYQATDNKAKYVQLILAGDLFPPFPGGKGTSKTTWTRVTPTTFSSSTTSDGGFQSVVVAPGTV